MHVESYEHIVSLLYIASSEDIEFIYPHYINVKSCKCGYSISHIALSKLVFFFELESQNAHYD